jgi:hypothetical protein
VKNPLRNPFKKQRAQEQVPVVVKWPRNYRPHLACEAEGEGGAREALEPVYVDPAGYLVAANGFVLTAVRCEISFPTVPDGQETPAFEGALIPRKLFDLVMTDEWVGNEPYGDASLAIVDGRAMLGGITVPLREERIGSGEHRHLYPNWRPLVPTKHGVALNLCMLGELTSIVSKAFDNDRLVYVPGKEPSDAILVVPRAHDGSFAVVMPWQMPDTATFSERLANIHALVTP